MNEVLIAVPALTWQVSVPLATFLCQVVGREFGPWRFHLAMAPEVSPVHYARNMLVGDFLRAPELTHLWFIDHDMIPEDATLRILEIEADIVAGRCLAARSGPDGLDLRVTAFSGRDPETGVFTAAGDAGEPVPIVGAGAANLLIRRAVLEDPRMHLSPDYVDLLGRPRSLREESDPAPAVFRTQYKPNGEVILSEDLDFVHRAAALGYRCIYQPAARMGHMKQQELNSIEAMLHRELRRRAAPGPAR